MAAKRKPELVRLEPETIGDKFHRAYKIGRRNHGYTYRSLAEHVRQIVPITDATIVRWEESLKVYSMADVPANTRLKMYYCLLALGVDPGDFDLDPDALSIPEQVQKVARDLLTPGSRCFSEQAA